MTSKSAVSISLSLLEKRDKLKIYLMIMFQVGLSILDLVGVALFAVLGALAINGTSSNSNGERVTGVLNFLNLNDLSIQKQAAFIGLLASSLLVIKTLSSLFFTRKIIFFLSVRSAHVTRDLTAQLLSQPLQTIQKRSMQQNIYALTGGVSNMMNQIIASSMAIISDLALVTIMLVGLFYLDPLMSILTLLIFGGVALGLFYLLHYEARKLGLKKGELDIRTIELIQEILLAYREAVAGSKRGYYVKKLAEQQISLATNVAKVNFLPNISKYVLEITVISGTVLISAFQFVRQDAAQSVAILTAFLAASSRIAPAILRIQQNAIQVKSNSGMAKPSIDLINEIRHLKITPEEKIHFSKNHGKVNWEIELLDVSFKYEGSSRLVLNKIDLAIPFGTLVSIVGKSGVGKTTLADMILGVNEPSSGKVLISGRKPDEICREFPGGLAYVSQDILMINGTIRQNICMGYNLEEVSDEDINASLQKANLLEFVNSLEKGIDTYIGDRGTKLSGGQKQRIGIARALLSMPRVLVMDEATSALDNESESAISESLHRIRGTTTIILIAHRIKTVMNSNLVVYLEDGSIKSKGTFREVREKIPNFDLAAIEVGL